MKSLSLQRLLDRGCPLHHLNRWFAEVDHSYRVPSQLKPRKRHCLADGPPVRVLSNGQFEMTAHIAAVRADGIVYMHNYMHAIHKHHTCMSQLPTSLEVARPG